MSLRKMHEQKKQASETSSTNSMLMKELQTKSKGLIEKNNKIERLEEDNSRQAREIGILQGKIRDYETKASQNAYQAYQLEEKKNIEIKNNNKENYQKSGAVLSAVVLYALVMTILWFKDNATVLKTVPEWFRSRGTNIKSVWNGVVLIYTWGYKLLEVHTGDFWTKAILIVLSFVIIVLIAYFGVKKGFEKLVKAWGELWRHYEYKGKKLLKASMTVVITMVSIPISVVVVQTFQETLNVFSWWLILSSVFNLAYHRFTYKD